MNKGKTNVDAEEDVDFKLHQELSFLKRINKELKELIELDPEDHFEKRKSHPFLSLEEHMSERQRRGILQEQQMKCMENIRALRSKSNKSETKDDKDFKAVLANSDAWFGDI